MKNKIKNEINVEDSFWADLQQESDSLESINRVLLNMIQDLLKESKQRKQSKIYI